MAKVKAKIILYETEIKKQTDLQNKNIADIMNTEKKMIDTLDEWMRDLRQHKKKTKEKFRE